MTEPSLATALVDRLVAAHGRKNAHRVLDAILDQIPVVEIAALAYDWKHVWARQKQRMPETDWRSFGHLTARGTGKTRSIASYLADEAEAGRLRCLGLAAQNEEKTIDVQVGGLIEASPPWFRPEWLSTARQLVWPNGALAYAHTPEVPGAIRSHNFDHAWLSEVQSWPTATRHEAYLNFKFATRVGVARTLWDATPKRRHPMLKAFLERSAANPERHIVVRGSIYENARNLAANVIADLEDEFGGTIAGREELMGEMVEDSEAALVKQHWIDDNRRQKPTIITYRAIGVDPAVTNRAGNDKTGIIDAAAGVDGHAYIMGDLTGKYGPGAWADVVIDAYVRGRVDIVVAETNKGGDLVAQNLRAAAGARGLRVEIVGKDEKPRHTPGVVYMREVHARGPKEDRAQPLATAYERGRVHHVLGVDLAPLEDTITTWEPTPGQRSPDALDAEVHAVGEILGFGNNKPDAKIGVKGVNEVARAIQSGIAAPRSIATLITGGRGGRI